MINTETEGIAKKGDQDKYTALKPEMFAPILNKHTQRGIWYSHDVGGVSSPD